MLSNNIKTGAFYLSLTINDKRIDRIFTERDAPPKSPYEPPIPDSLRVGAVQLRAQPCKNLRDYIAQMEEGVAKATAAGANLVCYPQYCGLLPLTLLPRFDRVLEELCLLERDEKNLKDAFRLVLENLSDFMLATYAATFSNLARYYGVYIMAGSTYVYEEGRITHRAYLFDPAGEIVGSQSKLLLSPFEEAFGVDKGSDIQLFDTLLGEVAILFEEDLEQFETAKIAANLGARLILTPGGQAVETETPGREHRRSLLPVLRAQEQTVYIARSAMVGRLGLTFTGDTAIYAPWPATKNQDGLLVNFPSYDQSGVAAARVPFSKLAEGVDPLAADRNEAFYREQLLPRYERRVGPLPVLELRTPEERSPSSAILLELLEKMPLPGAAAQSPLEATDELTAVEEFEEDIATALSPQQEQEEQPLDTLLGTDLNLETILGLEPKEGE